MLIKHKNGFKRSDKKDKINFNLIPIEPLKDLAIHYSVGAQVHGKDNWRKAKDLDTFRESAFRHFIAILERKTDEDHYSSLIWNIMCLKWHESLRNKKK